MNQNFKQEWLPQSTKRRIKDWPHLQIQYLQLNWITFRALSSYKRCFAQPVYSFKIMAEHKHSTRSRTNKRLLKIPTQTVLQSRNLSIQKRESLLSQKMPTSELEIHQSTSQANLSKIKMNSSTAMNPTRLSGILFRHPTGTSIDLRTCTVLLELFH